MFHGNWFRRIKRRVKQLKVAYFGIINIDRPAETLTSFGAKHLATATSKLLLRHVLWHDVMMCGFTRSGILLNIVLLLILVNPLLAAKAPANKREKIRQQAQEERQSEFVKGKSKKRRPRENHPSVLLIDSILRFAIKREIFPPRLILITNISLGQ